ncbi:glutamate 5-kinase [Alphaproteobacteria bacterium LSUCC0684]
MSTDFHKLTQTYLGGARTVIVKVGSALLVDDDTGEVRTHWLESLARDLAALHLDGCTPVVVSSGAIALGRHQLGRGQGRLKLEEKQAAAAIGQIRLAKEWQSAFALFGIGTAQILLSPDDTETRRRHLNARATIQTLLAQGIIPVVNENDTVATMEIRYGDNDRLAARVAQMITADVLVLLSDIDGLYSADPRQDPSARFLPEVIHIDDDILSMAGPAHSSAASGGMITKIAAARIATTAGCHMVICSGTEPSPISQLKDGGRCTWFRAAANPPQARKTWIAGGLTPKGRIILDDGAVKAIRSGKSLLPAGIARVEGSFERGDLVALADQNGAEIARGLSHYSAKDAALIAGSKSRAIPEILGYRGRDEVIHADDLVLTYHATRGRDTP